EGRAAIAGDRAGADRDRAGGEGVRTDGDGVGAGRGRVHAHGDRSGLRGLRIGADGDRVRSAALRVRAHGERVRPRGLRRGAGAVGFEVVAEAADCAELGVDRAEGAADVVVDRALDQVARRGELPAGIEAGAAAEGRGDALVG